MIETTGQPILIIGGTGVQGGNVARELLKHNYRVRVLSRNPQSAAAQEIAAKGAEIVQGDLADAGSLEPAMRGVSAMFPPNTQTRATRLSSCAMRRIWLRRLKKPELSRWFTLQLQAATYFRAGTNTKH